MNICHSTSPHLLAPSALVTPLAAAVLAVVLAGCGAAANSPSGQTPSSGPRPTVGGTVVTTTDLPSVVNGFTVPNIALPSKRPTSPTPNLDRELKFSADLALDPNSEYFNARHDLLKLGEEVCTDLGKYGTTKEEIEQNLSFGSLSASRAFVFLAEGDLCPS
jgi:hypothetical protein